MFINFLSEHNDYFINTFDFYYCIINWNIIEKIFHKIWRKMGKEGNNLNNFAIQCFNSINEIKVYSKINFFSNIFRNYKIKSLIAKRNASIIGEYQTYL